MNLRQLGQIAARQHGLVTFEAAAALGASRSGWYRSIERGHLELLHRHVARMAGHPDTPEQRILAAVLALRQGHAPPELVVASHRSAALLLGLDRPRGDPVDITTTAGHARRLNGVVVHRPTVLADLTPTIRRGIPCTNELRTLVDLGAVDPDAVAAALDRFAVTRRLTLPVLEALIERHSRPGRNGVGPLRRAVEAWPAAVRIPDSELEVAMARLLQDHGLPPATFHPRIAGFEVDFAIDDSPIVIECDGWLYHVADPSRWEGDLDRDAVLQAAGRIVLRRSRHQIVHEPAATAARIVALIQQWAPHLLPS